MNAYAYGEGDSVNGVDPTGHGFFSWLSKKAGKVFGGKSSRPLAKSNENIVDAVSLKNISSVKELAGSSSVNLPPLTKYNKETAKQFDKVFKTDEDIKAVKARIKLAEDNEAGGSVASTSLPPALRRKAAVAEETLTSSIQKLKPLKPISTQYVKKGKGFNNPNREAFIASGTSSSRRKSVIRKGE
ncbi:hypothetical protein CFBP3846_03265 [Pseudomonas syringae pv. avii]|uniref:Uncharacterized protein n=1 Tax=Pseudomonas syringae pv. avii TaxID=663959 RepID=A0ABY1UA50_PSESX|nr:hypothetical protein CFBP3846_03265 [Pseudomonas syringae pv. avii]